MHTCLYVCICYFLVGCSTIFASVFEKGYAPKVACFMMGRMFDARQGHGQRPPRWMVSNMTMIVAR